MLYGDRDVDGFDLNHRPMAVVDLTGGDQRVELTAAPPVDAVLRVTIGGELRLPLDYSLHLRNAWWQPPREVAAKGEIHVTFRPVDPAAACRIQFTADGFGASFYEVPPGAETRENVFDVALEPRPRLFIEVIPPADAAFDLRIQQRYGGGGETWVSGMRPQRIRTAGDRPARTINYEWTVPESLAGPIRLADVLSGATGPPIELDPGRPALTASFDLSRAFWLEGRVEAPPGALVEARVVAGPEEDPRPPWLQTSGSPVRPGSPVDGDGSFKVRLPGDRPVHVKPWHPSLVRDPRDADVVVTSERTPLLLRLVPGVRATFRILRPDRVLRPDPAQFPHLLLHARALLYEGEATGKPLATHPLSQEGGLYSFGGFVPGTYTVCLQLPLFAPMVLRNVALGDSVTHLGDLPFELGTMLTIQQPKELERRTQVQVSVVSVNGPPFQEGWRHLDSGELCILFTGLGPGRYKVSMRFRSGSPGEISRTIEVDGRTPVTITAER